MEPTPEEATSRDANAPTADAEPDRRGKRMAWIALGLLAVGVIAYLSVKPADERLLLTHLPDFELETLGAPGTISQADVKGHPTVINFWASWCFPCRQEAPRLEAAWKKYEDQGVRFLGIDTMDIERTGKRFLKEFGITYPNVRDPDKVLADPFNALPLPRTYFMYPSGRLLSGYGIYEISTEQLEEGIEAILEPEPSPSPD